MPALDEARIAEEVTSIFGDLIAIRSEFPPGDTSANCTDAAERLARAGFHTDVVTPAEPVANTIARMGRGAPCVAFNADADTVGVNNPEDWATDPYQATIKDGRLHGLGVKD